MSGAEPAGAPEQARRPCWLRMLRLVPLLALAAGAAWFFRDAPQETTLVYRLDAAADGLRALEIDYLKLPDRERVRHVEFLYAPKPAPRRQEHRVSLSRGSWLAEIALVYEDRTERSERMVTLERDTERIELALEKPAR